MLARKLRKTCKENLVLEVVAGLERAGKGAVANQ